MKVGWHHHFINQSLVIYPSQNRNKTTLAKQVQLQSHKSTVAVTQNAVYRTNISHKSVSDFFNFRLKKKAIRKLGLVHIRTYL